YMPESSERALKEGRGEPGDIVSFADGYPLLVASIASLAELNRRIVAAGRAAVPMNRFRANVVIDGTDAFAEDALGPVSLGAVAFRAASPCVRCQVTTTDQFSGELKGPEPLATLSTFRRTPDGPMFGTNLIPLAVGTLRVGDRVVWPDR
ncbi:MAG TPA: MOSC domain-containing protein, partial [Usitatibacteraceae bacterium]|nr:MOSC domain-containing protein [Usitatibacteraceae bacterium]